LLLELKITANILSLLQQEAVEKVINYFTKRNHEDAFAQVAGLENLKVRLRVLIL
jgi:hypothetical protein